LIFSASNIAWAWSDRLAAYEILARHDFHGLEIAPSLFFAQSKSPFLPSDSDIKQRLNELKGFDLEIVSMQSVLFGSDEARLFGSNSQFESFMVAIKNALILAGKLGIPNVVFGCPKNRIIPDSLSRSEAIGLAAEVFTRIGDLAKEAGTAVSLEPNPQIYGTNFLNTFKETHKFIETVDHPAITMMLDTGGLSAANELEDVLGSDCQLLGKLNHVHISEPYLSPAPKSSYEFEKVLEVLQDNDYSKAISIEMKRTSKSLEDLELSVQKIYSAVQRNKYAP
jgi:sugar phosphate isomerase/epimerase